MPWSLCSRYILDFSIMNKVLDIILKRSSLVDRLEASYAHPAGPCGVLLSSSPPNRLDFNQAEPVNSSGAKLWSRDQITAFGCAAWFHQMQGRECFIRLRHARKYLLEAFINACPTAVSGILSFSSYHHVESCRRRITQCSALVCCCSNEGDMSVRVRMGALAVFMATNANFSWGLVIDV